MLAGLTIALVVLLGMNYVRIRHVVNTSNLAQEIPPSDAHSPTGFAGGTRSLIVPEHNAETYHWVMQTQQMFARGEWRVRHIDYENAPFGREVHAASAYRWWLGLVAQIDHLLSGRPIGQSVERAALFADPLLQCVGLLALAGFVAWRFGGFAAFVVATGMAGLFPFAADFLPGLTEDRTLALGCAMGSLLLLIAGVPAARAAGAEAARNARRWFLCAGVLGGVGLWTSPAVSIPLIVGIAAGGLLASWRRRVGRGENGAPEGEALPWPAWALGGGFACLLTYLVEFAPDHLGAWQLRSVHPLYGVGWLGLGGILHLLGSLIERRPLRPRWAAVVSGVLAVAALAAVPVGMWRLHTLGFLEIDVASLRLARLPGGAAAANVAAWLGRDGLTLSVFATLFPLVLLLPAIWLLFRRSAKMETRAAMAIALGPALVALGFACRQLSWWTAFDAALLICLVVLAAHVRDASVKIPGRWIWVGALAVAWMAGFAQMFPRFKPGATTTLNESEVYGLVERDLARWLSNQAGAGKVVVLAPNNVTSTLCFYGSMRGLGTLSWENQDGVGAAVRIASASTPEEAKELIEGRGITHIVIPSWDSYLDVYARMGMGQMEGTFMNRLHNWKLPPWLRPVAYQLPTIHGFEGQSLIILEVVEDQEDAVALSRVAEYFMEMKQLELAASVSQALRRFPADIGALVARAQVELARNDATAFGALVDQLRARLTGNADRRLAWDRRVGLAVVFARAKQSDLARKQVQRCFADADEGRLRSLSTGSLYRLLVLGRAYESSFGEAKLRELALSLLPAEMRARL